MFLFKSLEILLFAFFGFSRHEYKGSRHCFRNFGSLSYFAHSLSHLILVRVLDSNDLVGCGNLSLTDLVTILEIVLQVGVDLIIFRWFHFLKF